MKNIFCFFFIENRRTQKTVISVNKNNFLRMFKKKSIFQRMSLGFLCVFKNYSQEQIKKNQKRLRVF